MTDLSDTLFTSPEMAAVFSGATFVQRMLDFEAALARAQAAAGVIPQGAADAIAAQCRAEQFDAAALFRDAADAGTAAIPLVRRLTDLLDGDVRGFVHWGATSQDVIDTATMVQIRDGLGLLTGGLGSLASACAALADHHRHTPMAGRTLLQHAVPITFGLKAARWLGMTTRLISRLSDLREHACVVQLGGAAGTLAAMGDRGLEVMESVAGQLGLGVPELPWHAERDRIAEIASALGTAAGAMGKIATDLILLSQTEIGEASPGAPGTSSAMPQKRNPVEATNGLACARLAIAQVPVVLAAMVHEHERSAGEWQPEWQAIPDLFRFTAGAVRWVERAVSGLQVDAGRMRGNLELTHGLIMAESLTMALASKIGRPEAYRVVQRLTEDAAKKGTSLREAAASDGRVGDILPAAEIDRALDAAAYRGSTDAFIDRALQAFHTLQSPAGGRR
ncbi:MAG: 3-carboxy-cis,cis-muconate cycloisomerase [bacterium]